MTTPYAPKQPTARGHTVQVNNLEMYYEEYGVGEPLVLMSCDMLYYMPCQRLRQLERPFTVTASG
jgi:hypothetical protein